MSICYVTQCLVLNGNSSKYILETNISEIYLLAYQLPGNVGHHSMISSCSSAFPQEITVEGLQLQSLLNLQTMSPAVLSHAKLPLTSTEAVHGVFRIRTLKRCMAAVC